MFNRDSHTTEHESSPSIGQSANKAMSPDHHDAKSSEPEVYPQRNGLLGPIICLDRCTPISLHEIIKPLTIPSRNKLLDMDRWTKKTNSYAIRA